jgi:hypothetical protein
LGARRRVDLIDRTHGRNTFAVDQHNPVADRRLA